MKRAFANIGFTFAVTLIILNFLNVKWALAVFSAVSVLFVIFIAAERTRKAAALPLSMLSAALACVVFATAYNTVFLPQKVLYDQTVAAEIYIVEIEEKTGSGYAYTVKTKSIEMANAPQNIKLTLYSRQKVVAESYEILNAEISLFSAGENAFDSHGSFDDDIFLNGFLNAYGRTYESAGGIESLNRYFIELREELRNDFSQTIGGDAGALSLAVLTGDTSTLSSEAYNNFKACGATHLMAVSGFNLAVFTGMLYKLLRRMLCPKLPLTVICAASVIFYVFLAGFSASMIRAAIMMLVFLVSKLLSEKADSLNSLGFAAFLVCLNPFAVTDAGALLTFAAVLGLVVLSPYLNIKLKTRFKPLKSSLDIITASVSVFITTFPIMYFMFGEVSIIGLLLNVVLIPLSEILMLNSIAFAALSASSVLSSINVFLARAVGKAMLKITEVCAGFSFSTVNIGSELYAILIFSIFVIFAAAFFIKSVCEKRLFKQCTVISCVFAVLISAFSAFGSNNHTYLRIMHGEYSNAILVYNHENAVAFGITEYEQYYTAKKIVEANDLYLAMVIDYDGKYSASLAEECGCLNYVSDYDVSDYKLDHSPVGTDDFSAELWEGLEVSRCGGAVLLRVENTYFKFDFDALANPENYDIIYTVNKAGYSVKGVNKWAG